METILLRDRPGLSGAEAGTFFGALAAARDSMGDVTRDIAREYGLGPRGPWLVALIGRGPISPNEVADLLNIGRSLVTAELGQLQDAGLINHERSSVDKRRVLLTLTPTGMAVAHRVSDGLVALLDNRLPGYSREEILLVGRVLTDLGGGNHYG
ncbi:MarR family winged helix-turn-helix transcriptional regulator [Novosphingobium bradum]|uniref:MarR family winged helix-turn-helix transcriptional regulator n=1 Tax=Novosphingobium bradum TaxID=1737444 RepID=A0ABV7IN24_9SPHN